MDENSFMVAIQAILTKAREEGWPMERITDAAHEAIQEFEDEHIGEDDSDALRP